MNQVIDFSTLTWVKKELDETLKEARQALEAHVENPGDEARLEALVAHLHQVYGTLQMVELYGASLLAEEMEQVARSLAAGTVNQQDDAREVLMRAILQLPDYLDRLISGQRDIPVVLLPLLNDMRAVRGDNLLSDNAMFTPDLAAELPAHISSVAVSGDARDQVRELRHRFQLGLLGWFRGQNTDDSLNTLLESLDGLQNLGGDARMVRLWWAAAGLVEALVAGKLEGSVAIKRVLGQVDREIKRLIDEGHRALTEDVRVDLFKSLLFYCAQVPADTGERIAEIQTTYRLRELLPDEQELSAARESLSGRNSDLFETVAVAVREELARLKDSLDIILRNGCKDSEELNPLIDALRRLGDTLGMLGLGAARKAVVAKADDLQTSIDAGAAPADTVLMDVASTLLLVESSVDNMGAGRAVVDSDGQAEEQLARNDYQQVMDVVVEEAIGDLVRAKEAIVSYTESDHDTSLITEVPQWFNQVKGGMLLLGDARPAALVDSIARYVSGELVDAGRQADQQELDALADAVCGLEYYLESRREHRMYGGSAMEVAEQSVQQLGYPADETTAADEAAPVQGSEPDSGSPSAETDSGGADAGEALDFDFSVIDEPEADAGASANESDGSQPEADMSAFEPGDLDPQDAAGAFQHEQEAPSGDSGTAHETQPPGEEGAPAIFDEQAEESAATDAGEDDGLAIIGEDVDEEILEIFIEEAEEELASINEQLPLWLGDRDNSEALGTMRRSWHTLKGSGRLVGAMRIGEFAWSFENMLNRVIDGTVSAGADMKELLQDAVQALPGLIRQVKDGTPTPPITQMMRHAEALGRGEAFEPEGQAQAVEADSTDATAEFVEPLPELGEDSLSVDQLDRDAGLEEVASADSGDDESRKQDAGEADYAAGTDSEGEMLSGSVMDTQLYEIFNTESRAHLEVVSDYLEARRNGVGSPADESLVRALHTLHGSAHMADAHAIADLAGALEKLLKTVMTGTGDADDAVCHVLEDSVRVIESMLSSLPHESFTPDEYIGVLRQVEELCAAESERGGHHEAAGLADADWSQELSGDEGVMEAADEMPEASGVADQELPESPELSFQESGEAGSADEDAATGAFDTAMEEAQVDASDAMEALQTAAGSDESDDFMGAHPPEAGDAGSQAAPESAQDSTDDAWHAEQAQPEDHSEAEAPPAGDGDPYADYDQELLEIFLEEAGENLEIADAALGNWSESSDDEEALAELQRALHTLKGGARMAELPAVGDVAHAVEALIIAISEGRADAGLSIESVQQAQDCLAGMIERIRARQPVEPAEELVAVLNSRREEATVGEEVREDLQTPEQAGGAGLESFADVDPYAEVDPELLEVFLEEAGDIMEHCEQTLHGWKRAPDDQELMAELQRELHTLKGGARMSDITEIGDLAHAVESLMVQVGAGEIACSDSLFNVLERAQDRLAAMVEQVRGHQPLEAAVQIVADLENLRNGVAVEAQADTADSRTEEDESAVGVAMVEQTERRERRSKSRASQELVRVKADLLDNMVNYAGEVSIYRSRLEQQIGAYSFNLVEMEQTVARVRDQLRKLEIETEAQVLYRYEREGEMFGEERAAEGADFDPLEMDRYSHMQQLSRSLMESVSDLSSIQNLLENITRESETLLLQQSRVNTELQEGLMRTRMVPFLGLAARMRRIVRQTAQELGKKAELELSGAEGEMDRTVVDRIVAPLEHMLRNSISHGIESPQQRVAAGKPETGTIRITLERESSEVVLRIADDGAGINLEAIRKKAIARGLMEAGSELTDREVLQFILETGFSTAEQVTQVAGRGVGMDVVNSEVKQLGGSLYIDSEPGRGTMFTIRLPFTLALNHALLIEVGEDTYAIPLSSIEGIVRMRREDLKAYYHDPESRFEYGGYAYEVRHLGSTLGTGSLHLDSGPKRVPVLLSRFGEHCVAFHVENLLGSREIVVKSVGPQISTVPGVSGATILGDGRVVMILELAALLRGGTGSAAELPGVVAGRPATAGGITVMVVDDSITVRKVTTRVLERNDMNVIAAKDGVDAVSKLQENIPDIMLLDIEMPRMDGFELATHVRNEPRLRDIPMIMITSRTGDKHRQRAMQIGVNRYLGKPFQESELLESIQALLEETAVDG